MTSSLNIASRALSANLAALQVVGHNIANVNTDGYSRQNIQLTTSGGQLIGNGYFGKGVEIAGVTRAYSSFLTREAQATRSLAESDSTRYQRLQQLEALFPLGDQSLGAVLNDALNAWSAVASSPTDSTARTVAISRAEDLAARLRDTSANLEGLRQSAHTQVEQTIQTVNTLAQQIAQINLRVIEAKGADRSPNDLLDQRDQLVTELNKYIQTTPVEADNGSLTLFVGGSQPLVLGGSAASMQVLPSYQNAEDPQRVEIVIKQSGKQFSLNEDLLGGGSLRGLLQFINDDLPSAVNALGRMTVSLVEQFNAQHRLGLDLQGNPGGDFFSPITLDDAKAVSVTGTGVLTPVVTDPTALKSTDYRIRFDTANSVIVTNVADGTETGPITLTAPTPPATASSFTIDGLRIDIAGTPVAGDTYYMRPFAKAASQIDVAIAQPQNLAAASPVKVDAQLSTSSGLTVESVRLVSGSPTGLPTFDLSYDPTTGGFNVVGLQSPATVVSQPTAYMPGEPMEFTIDNGSGNVVTYSVTLRGAPSSSAGARVTANLLPGSTLTTSNLSVSGVSPSRLPVFDLTYNPLTGGFDVTGLPAGVTVSTPPGAYTPPATSLTFGLDLGGGSIATVSLDVAGTPAAVNPVAVSSQLVTGSDLTLDAVTPTVILGSPSTLPTFDLVYNNLTGEFDIAGLPAGMTPTPPTLTYTPGVPMTVQVDMGGGDVVSYDVTISGAAPQDGDTFTLSAATGDSFTLSAAGDRLTLSQGSGTEMRQNYGNAQALLDLRDVTSFDGAVTLADGYISVFSELAGRVQTGKVSAEFSETAATNAEAARANVSGVNLDEEAARLMQFQQAYQAVAKYLQVAQGTFDTLIQTFR